MSFKGRAALSFNLQGFLGSLKLLLELIHLPSQLLTSAPLDCKPSRSCVDLALQLLRLSLDGLRLATVNARGPIAGPCGPRLTHELCRPRLSPSVEAGALSRRLLVLLADPLKAHRHVAEAMCGTPTQLG